MSESLFVTKLYKGRIAKPRDWTRDLEKTCLSIAADDTAVCSYMKQITLEKVRNTLRDLAPAVEVPQDTAAKARIAIDRMLAIHA